MICVYPADCTDFSTNGNGTLTPLSAEVTETLNGEYELTLVHPIDDAGKWQRLVEDCILSAPVPAATTPRVNFTAPGDDNRTEVWRVNTDFSCCFFGGGGAQPAGAAVPYLSMRLLYTLISRDTD